MIKRCENCGHFTPFTDVNKYNLAENLNWLKQLSKKEEKQEKEEINGRDSAHR